MSLAPNQPIEITTVTNDGKGQSFFSSRAVELNGSIDRRLSDQINAENFRLRKSDSSYSSSFHVAGDPTLLVILSGTVRIELRNAGFKDFSGGDMFIAEDYLSVDVPFDNAFHGHRAEVVGEEELTVLHLKLEKRV